LEGAVCQPSDFGGNQPDKIEEVTNDDPTVMILVRLGRQDGLRVTFNTLPGSRQSQNARSSSVCYLEVFATNQGANEALRAQQAFPANVQSHESQLGNLGDATRAFEGTVLDSTGKPVPFALITWQRGRYLGAVSITGPAAEIARAAALTLATAMDGRISRLGSGR
jgi:hypothetical protein